MQRSYTIGLTLLLWSMCTVVYAQIGGKHTYKFLSLSPTARGTAQGGMSLATYDKDGGLGYANPSLYNSEMGRQLTLNTVLYPAGINYGYIGYIHPIDTLLTVAGGVQYVHYGKFTATDNAGNVLGDFSASEYALHLSAARRWGKWSAGGSLKGIFSDLESYQSVGIAADVAMTYHIASKRLAMGLIAKNIGAQITTYAGLREPLPFDLQLALTHRLRYLPFRITLLLHHLHQWDIRYDDPAATAISVFGTQETQKKPFVDNLFRHAIFAGEFYLGKALQVQVAYNHMRRREMQIEGVGSMAGLSFGVGIHTRKLLFNYAYSAQYAGGGMHHFSVNWRFVPRAAVAPAVVAPQ